MKPTTMTAAALMLTACIASAQERAPLATELFDAALQCPGGDIAFGLRLERPAPGEIRAFVNNGEETIAIPVAREAAGTLTLAFDYYDSQITARRVASGGLAGEWRKRRSKDEWVTMPFTAAPPGMRTMDIQPPPAGLIGRWRAKFASEPDDAVAVIDARFDRRDLRGTFLTTTGDYRYLAGAAWDDRVTHGPRELRLSCFDGSHAFLFKARPRPDGSLEGDFWSGPSFHDTWNAVRDDDAALPDPFGLTRFTGTAEQLDALAFTDSAGTPRSIGEFKGRPRLIEIFGTWCPNCLDATRLLVELDSRYRARGLVVLGLAFEATGDADRDRGQVALYARRHQVEYPLLIAGTRDKQQAAKNFPVIDRLRAYPTFLFINADGTIAGVYTGFSGPATGEEHERLKRAFEERIRGMLGG